MGDNIMRTWILILIASLNCVAVSGYAEEKVCEGKVENYREMLEKGTWFPFKMVFPENYVVLPVAPSEDVGLEPGFFVGEKEAIEDLWAQSKKDENAAPNPRSGVFLITWSWNVSQTGPKDFSESEKEARNDIKRIGATFINFGKYDWNGYPVQTLEAKMESVNVTLAYIGLNSGGEVLKVQYITPQNSKPDSKDWTVWKQFIQKSTGVSPDDFFKALKAQEG